MGIAGNTTHLGAAVGSHATEAEQAQPTTILVVRAVENYTCLIPAGVEQRAGVLHFEVTRLEPSSTFQHGAIQSLACGTQFDPFVQRLRVEHTVCRVGAESVANVGEAPCYWHSLVLCIDGERGVNPGGLNSGALHGLTDWHEFFRDSSAHGFVSRECSFG